MKHLKRVWVGYMIAFSLFLLASCSDAGDYFSESCGYCLLFLMVIFAPAALFGLKK